MKFIEVNAGDTYLIAVDAIAWIRPTTGNAKCHIQFKQPLPSETGPGGLAGLYVSDSYESVKAKILAETLKESQPKASSTLTNGEQK